MKKTLFTAAMLLLGATIANAQSYTTLGVGINPPTATLHVHSSDAIDPGTGNQAPHIPDDPGDGPRSGGGSGTFFPYDYQTTFKLTNGNTSSGGFMIHQDNLDITLWQHEQGKVKFFTPAGLALVIEADGCVGIGTSNSSYGLNVEKTSRFAQPVTLAQTLDVSGLLTAGGGLSVSGPFSVGSKLTISGNTTICHTLRVSHDQTVDGSSTVLGSQTIGHDLTVAGALAVGSGLSCDAAGNMKVKHLRVTTSDWPDYVFAEGYRLMPLGEVEAYVKQEGHLPEVPAAAEMEQDGVDQGELNRLLMQKVEELTLYVIDLQKQIEELKADNR